jgi:heme/copper-type cytochrome/quinol oxidase subunit 3
MRQHRVLDVSGLPTYGFGPRMTMTWGTMGFILLEGMGFALAIGVYLYLAIVNPEWPLSAPPPGLLWSSLLTAVVLLSLWPNQLAARAARKLDLPGARLTLIIMSAVGLIALGLRAFEFTTLNVTWDFNAYGSIVWFLLGLHTTHLLTDVGDTIVLTVLMFTRHVEGKRFSDVEDNAVYWYFVVLAWLPIYALIYWGPRL